MMCMYAMYKCLKNLPPNKTKNNFESFDNVSKIYHKQRSLNVNILRKLSIVNSAISCLKLHFNMHEKKPQRHINKRNFLRSRTLCFL